jgi:hypothetical protein
MARRAGYVAVDSGGLASCDGTESPMLQRAAAEL